MCPAKSLLWSDKTKMLSDIKKNNNKKSKIEKRMNSNQHFAITKKKERYATFRERNKGPTTYATEEDFFFFFQKNNVHALCLTTVRLWSDISKFCFARVQ